MSTSQSAAVDNKKLKKFMVSDTRKSLWQIANSVIPYLALMAGMYWSLEYSYLLTLLLAIPAAGFLIRIFIIFHDCGHGSFFASKRWNNITGIITGLFAFVPYYQWRHDHAQHHATCSDLDRRGIGDVWTLTVEEYKQRSPLKRLLYRLYRNPIFMFGIGPIYTVLIANRLVTRGAKSRERKSVHLTNLALLAIVTGISLLIGLETYLLLQVPVMVIAWSAGIWLFYVQHQFEEVYWERHENWDYFAAAVQGSSFYKLPRILQWFTGNIGFHHIHHLSARIPNYNLPTCHNEMSIFKNVKPLTLATSLKSAQLSLWDEQAQKMVSFSELRQPAMATNI